MSEKIQLGGEIVSDAMIQSVGQTAAEALLKTPDAAFVAPVGRDDTTYTVPTGDA